MTEKIELIIKKQPKNRVFKHNFNLLYTGNNHYNIHTFPKCLKDD